MVRDDKGQFAVEYKLNEYQNHYERYSQWVNAHTEKTTTINRLCAGVRAWLSWCEKANVDPLTADEDDVRRYIIDKRTENADTTLVRRVATVSKYYHYHLHHPTSEVDIDDNPTSNINLRKDYKIKQVPEYLRVLSREGRDDIVALPFSRIEPLFEEVRGKDPVSIRDELICRLLWQTALRCDELSRIRIDNIDFEDRDIKIRSAKLDPDEHPQLYHRHVWWETNLDELLYEWIDSARAQLSKYADSSPYLFLTTRKEQMRPSHISRIVKTAAHGAGVQEPLTKDSSGEVKQWLYTGHRLRHSRITYLVNETELDLNWVRMMAGHSQVDTTLQYVREDWDLARSAFRDALEL